MEINLTKHIFGQLDIDDKRLLGCFGPREITGPGHSQADIADRLRRPIGTPRLKDLARGKKEIVIVTDDNTRATPLPLLLPPVLAELKAGGVSDDQISFLIGLGTHRAMTENEIEAKFGTEIVNAYRIVNHEWDNPHALVSLGTCDLGFDVVVNRVAVDADLLLSVGSIVPHATTGFSAGGKTIIPGICGEKTIEETHWKALDFQMSDMLGVFDNPVRKAVVSVCQMVGLKTIMNSILFEENGIYDLVVGDVEGAHRKGVEICKEVYGVRVPGRADVVIAEAYPNDIDLRQAIKAICAADIVCRDGGVIILPAECSEGIAPQFPEFAKYGFRDPDLLFCEVEEGRFQNKLMAYTLVAIGRIISKRVSAILVCPNIDAKRAEEIGFIWAADLQDAVDKARRIAGDDSKVAVLQQAGELLPLLATQGD